RTEILLTAPIFFYLLMREPVSEPTAAAGGLGSHPKKAGKRKHDVKPSATAVGSDKTAKSQAGSWPTYRKIAVFCTVPIALGIATLVYNYVRFGSITDFGYARIPGVLKEPWYDHGIFSTYYIPRQAWEMLIRPWEWRQAFPYLVPNPFSSSILLSSP